MTAYSRSNPGRPRSPARVRSTASAPLPAVAVPRQPSGTTADKGIDYRELWKVLRVVLVAWAFGVWLLLVLMPGLEQISSLTSAMLHLPHIFIRLGIYGALFAAYNLRSDGHMLWFLGALLLLAGWM